MTMAMGRGAGTRTLGALVLAGVLGASAAPADVLKTRDGQMRNGVFRGASEEVLKFETPDGGLHLIPVEKVESLRFGAAPAMAGGDESAAPATGRTAEGPVRTPEPAPAAASSPPSAAPEAPARSAAPAAQTAPVAQRIVLPAGSRLRVRITDSIDPRRSTEGDRFAALLESPIAVGDQVLAPARSKVYGVVAAASTTGPIANRLQLELTDLQIQGRRVEIVTGTHQPAAAEAGGPDAPADAAPAPPREARVASGTLLEFRLLQPLELQLVH